MSINYAKNLERWEAEHDLRKARGASLQQRDFSGVANPDEWLLQALLGRTASATGITVTPLRMLGISTVYACMRVISEAIATMPLVLYRAAPAGRGRVRAYEHQLYSALAYQPNGEMTAADFLGTMQANLSLRQNAFAEILRDGDGDPIGLYPIDPAEVRVNRKSGSLELEYQYQKTGVNFKPRDILHLKGYSRNGVMGIDLTVSVNEVIALALALQDNAAKFFGNGSKPGGFLEHPASLSAEAQQRLRDQMEQSTTGVNAYRMMVLEEGLKYNATRSENKDSQFQEAREYQDLQICRIFGVPPHKVGITSGQPRANVEQENISFVVDTLRPQCVKWEQALNMKLLNDEERDQGYQFEFLIDSLLRGDKQSRYSSYALGRQWGWLSPNDVREAEGMNPIEDEGGDEYLRPLNMVPLGSEETGDPQGNEGEGKDTPDDEDANQPGKNPKAQKNKPGGRPKNISATDDTGTAR